MTYTGPLRRWEPLLPALAALAVHAPSAGNAFYTHDCWNAAQLGERVLAGALGPFENIERLLVVLSFGLRAKFGLSPLAWHLPNLMLHAANAALVTVLATQLRASRLGALVAGLLVAVMPLLAHPVEWVGGGYDLVATLGLLGALTATFAGQRTLAALFAVVALLGKEVGLVVAPVVAIVWLARCGWPRGKEAWRALLLSVALPALLTAAVLGIRAYQVQHDPADNLAGRTVGFDPAKFAVSAPVALGAALLGPFAEDLDLDREAPATTAAFIALPIALALAVWRRSRTALGLLVAAAVALGPVSLIGLERAELLANTRYLYTSAALLAPFGPLLVAGARWPRLWQALGGAVLVLATWGGRDRVLEGVRAPRAVAAVIEAATALPWGSRLVVLTGFYDEPTARFLMSEYLAQNRGVNARYVLRGTGVTYARRPHHGSDAALAYFGAAPRPFDPATVTPNDRVWLHDLTAGTVADMTLPPPAAAPADDQGEPTELPVAFVSIARDDPDDEPLTVDGGRSMRLSRNLGPPAGATLLPDVAMPLPPGPPIRAIELTVRARIHDAEHYAAGYLDRWIGVFIGPPLDAAHGLSAELRGDGSPETIRFRLDTDPVLAGTSPTALGLLPLNYPGELTVDRVRVWR